MAFGMSVDGVRLQNGGGRAEVRLPFGTLLGNAIRRALIADASSAMADRVRVLVNTTARDNEVVAQRIGLLRFAQEGCTESARAEWRSEGARKDVLARDATGPVATLDDDVVIARVRDAKERFHAVATFRRSTGSEHARFCPVVAVGCAPAGDDGEAGSVVSFETLFPDDHRRVWHEACDALIEKVEALRRAAAGREETSEDADMEDAQPPPA